MKAAIRKQRAGESIAGSGQDRDRLRNVISGVGCVGANGDETRNLHPIMFVGNK